MIQLKTITDWSLSGKKKIKCIYHFQFCFRLWAIFYETFIELSGSGIASYVEVFVV